MIIDWSSIANTNSTKRLSIDIDCFPDHRFSSIVQVLTMLQQMHVCKSIISSKSCDYRFLSTTCRLTIVDKYPVLSTFRLRFRSSTLFGERDFGEITLIQLQTPFNSSLLLLFLLNTIFHLFLPILKPNQTAYFQNRPNQSRYQASEGEGEAQFINE